jgi:hypothetical protein
MLTSAKTWVELQNIESGVYQVGLLNKNSGTFVQRNWLFIDEN